MPARSPRGQTTQLNAQQAKFVTHNQSELAAHLPNPRCAWRWSDVELSRRTLGYLRHVGLIEPVDSDAWRWETTRKLWRALPRYCEDPSPGTVAGQVRFDALPEPTRTRIEADATGAPRVEAQATLSGGERALRAVREVREDDEERKFGMVLEADVSGRREVPTDQTTLRDVVEEVGATVPRCYHPEVHRAARHPAQQTLSEVSPP